MVVGGGEGPGGNVDKQNTEQQEAKLRKQVDEMADLMAEAGGLDTSDSSTKRFAEIVVIVVNQKNIPESQKNDYLIQLQKIAEGTEESARTDRLTTLNTSKLERSTLVQDIVSPKKSPVTTIHSPDITSTEIDIPESADINQISEFINDEGVQEMFQNMVPEYPGKIGESTQYHMVVWEQIQSGLKKMESQGGDKFKIAEKEAQALSIDFRQLDLSNIDDMKKNFTDIIQPIISKVYGAELGKEMASSYEKISAFQDNLSVLEKHEGIDDKVDLTKMNVLQELMNETGNISDTNIESIVSKLQNTSNEDYDENDAIEDIITNTNELDAKSVKLFSEQRDKIGEGLARSIIEGENNWGISNLTDMISKSLKEGGALAAIMNLVFGPKFAEAFAEGNVKKQKSLINIVKISNAESTEGFKIDGTDFSNIKSSDLKGFFKSMDSRGIDYSKEDFWENILTGESKEGLEDDSTIALHEELTQSDGEYLTFDGEDFAGSNKGFLERLNAIPVKAKEEEEGESDEGESEDNSDNENGVAE